MKLTKEIAYLIGFWKMRRTREGIGIVGGSDIQQRFIKEILKQRLIPPEKIKINKKAIVFHHIKIRKFFEKVVENQNDLFGKRSKLSAAYLRGIYESSGNGNLIEKATFRDRMLIEQLGFYTKRIEKKVYVRNLDEFLGFIKS